MNLFFPDLNMWLLKLFRCGPVICFVSSIRLSAVPFAHSRKFLFSNRLSNSLLSEFVLLFFVLLRRFASHEYLTDFTPRVVA